MTNNWEIRFSELQNHLEENREYPTKQENPVLYNWITDQRKRKSYMKSAEMNKLNSVNFIWNAREYKWNKMFCQLLEHSKISEFEPSVKTNKKLSLWYRDQKTAIKKGLLRQDRADKFNSIKFSEPAYRWRWLLRYEKLKTWREANPDKWPHYNYNDPKSEESKLHVFCQIMRKYYRDNNLSESWFRKLDEINFNFRGSTDNWLKNYNKIKKLIEEHHSVSVKVIGKNANDWILRHKKKLNEGKLSKKKAALVKQLQLDRFIISWDTRFNSVKQWIEENGKLPTGMSQKYYYGWLTSQRVRYKKGTLSEDQVKKIGLIGFELEPEERKKKWLRKFNEYKNFIEEHGKEPSYFANDYEKKLYVWSMAQRAVKAGTARNRKPLSKEIIGKLNAVNFSWVGLGPGKGISWDERFSSHINWTNNMLKIAAFIRKNGRYPVRSNSRKEDNLYQSLARTRRKGRAGQLSDKQLRLINELNMEL